eukprot:GILK01007810.1.p1 GENE.GILK01007810.1~~GILK01007810.1.p1  ORF type:complete len:312 (+),score=30.83 GILK01007810.1:64-999(+)
MSRCDCRVMTGLCAGFMEVRHIVTMRFVCAALCMLSGVIFIHAVRYNVRKIARFTSRHKARLLFAGHLLTLSLLNLLLGLKLDASWHALIFEMLWVVAFTLGGTAAVVYFMVCLEICASHASLRLVNIFAQQNKYARRTAALILVCLTVDAVVRWLMDSNGRSAFILIAVIAYSSSVLIYVASRQAHFVVGHSFAGSSIRPEQSVQQEVHLFLRVTSSLVFMMGCLTFAFAILYDWMFDAQETTTAAVFLLNGSLAFCMLPYRLAIGKLVSRRRAYVVPAARSLFVRRINTRCTHPQNQLTGQSSEQLSAG